MAPIPKRLAQALIDAYQHVKRQEIQGKHEQDRQDAVEWLEKHGLIVAQCRKIVGYLPGPGETPKPATTQIRLGL